MIYLVLIALAYETAVVLYDAITLALELDKMPDSWFYELNASKLKMYLAERGIRILVLLAALGYIATEVLHGK